MSTSEEIEQRKHLALTDYVNKQEYNFRRFVSDFSHINENYFASDNMAVHEIVANLQKIGILIRPEQASQILIKNMEIGIDNFKEQYHGINYELEQKADDGLDDKFMEDKHLYENKANALFQSLYNNEDQHLHDNRFFTEAIDRCAMNLSSYNDRVNISNIRNVLEYNVKDFLRNGREAGFNCYNAIIADGKNLEKIYEEVKDKQNTNGININFDELFSLEGEEQTEYISKLVAENPNLSYEILGKVNAEVDRRKKEFDVAKKNFGNRSSFKDIVAKPYTQQQENPQLQTREEIHDELARQFK